MNLPRTSRKRPDIFFVKTCPVVFYKEEKNYADGRMLRSMNFQVERVIMAGDNVDQVIEDVSGGTPSQSEFSVRLVLESDTCNYTSKEDRRPDYSFTSTDVKQINLPRSELVRPGKASALFDCLQIRSKERSFLWKEIFIRAVGVAGGYLDTQNCTGIVVRARESKLVITPPACPVCLKVFRDGDETCRLQCGHLYHLECVSPWLEKKRSCPYCRSKVIKLKYEDYIEK